MTNTSIGKISFSFIISALMLAAGLVNISLSFNLAHAIGAPTTNHVITGDTQKYRDIRRIRAYDATIRCWHGYQSNARHV